MQFFRKETKHVGTPRVFDIPRQQLLLQLDLKFGNLQHEDWGYWRATEGSRDTITFAFSPHGSTEKTITLFFVATEKSNQTSLSWKFSFLAGESETDCQIVEETGALLENLLQSVQEGTGSAF